MTSRHQLSNSKLALLYDSALQHYEQGRFELSLARFDAILAECAVSPAVHVSRGSVLLVLDRTGEALECFDEALRLEPSSATAAYSRGVALQKLGVLNEALESYSRAIALDPNLPKAHHNRAFVLRELGHMQESLESFDRAIALDPSCADFRYGKATALLLVGRFEEGLELYEWRKKLTQWLNYGPRLESSLWTGAQPLEGKTLLIHAEQGLGDTIQFCRYARILAQSGAKTILLVQAKLARLLRSLGEEISVIASGEDVPAHDYHVPLLSLPLAFRTRSHNIPHTVPYLFAESDKKAYWHKGFDDGLINIGVCWQGNKQSAIDAGRSFPVECLEQIAQIRGVRLISLQKNDGIEQLRSLRTSMQINVLADGFDEGQDSFIDTAAIMEHLQLVITSDTAIAHLAGALGRPTWVALRHVPDWRWLLDDVRCPWYPTMHLFRQSFPGNWQSVFAAMQAELKKLYDL